jgi:hypothetical protein
MTTFENATKEEVEKTINQWLVDEGYNVQQP